MSESIPCFECENPILPATAEKTGGLCMPCKNGTRARQDMSARMLAMPSAVRQTAEWRHLDWLNNAVYSGKLGKLKNSERTYLALRWFYFAIDEGGLARYFATDLSSLFEDAKLGLEAIGASEWLAAVIRGRDLLNAKTLPKSLREKRDLVEKVDFEELASLTANLDLDDLLNEIRAFAKSEGLLNSFEG